MCTLSDLLSPLVRGLERSDSIAFDFHKWMYVQYDAGCVLVRDGELHKKAFATRPDYLNIRTAVWPAVENGLPTLALNYRAAFARLRSGSH